MSDSADITELFGELRANASMETYPVASSADIQLTESAIARALPHSYKRFVTEFSNGAYLLGIQEVSAVGEGNPQIMPIQRIATHAGEPDELIPLRDGGEPVPFASLVPFGLDSNGNEWCFITSSEVGNECAVAYLDTAGRKLYGQVANFTDWLAILLDQQDEVIRTLYDTDVLYDELNLG